MGLFDKLKQGLKKTSQILNTDIRDLFKSEGRLVDDAFLEELQEILVKTDMGYQAAQASVEQVRSDFRARVVHMDDVLAAIKKKLVEIMGKTEGIRFAAEGPTVIMVAGVNGTGKTTSIAKLAHLLKSEGKSVVLGAGDTFRAAAVEQLSIWAERLGVPIVKAPQGSDPASVAHRAVAAALEQRADVCIVDTAGRLHNQANLMQELSKIHRVLGKQIPAAPHEVLLVLDATTGQSGVRQAEAFTKAVQCTGIILAKIDGTAKGGVVVPIRQQVGLPVKFIGVGERAEDLAVFRSEEFADALFEGLLAPT
jgi:fused signal recognition particle receptor